MVEHFEVPTKKVRIEPVKNAASENRKLRNRLSQKAFRARQSLYIKDLEKKLEWASKPESDQNAKLEETNKTLRSQLLDCHKKLESFQVTLKALADSVAYALGIEQKPTSELEPTLHGHDDSDDAEPEVPPTQSNVQSEWTPGNQTSLNSTFYDFSDIPSTNTSLHTQPLVLSPKHQSSQLNIHDQSHVENETIAPSIVTRLPSNDITHFSTRETFNPINLTISSSYQHMMGPSQYNSYLVNNSMVQQDQPLQINHTNSPISDHINGFENALRQKLSKLPALVRGNERLLDSAYLMLSTLISASWPSMAAWYCATKAHIPLSKVITYHVNPTAATYAELGANGAWLPTKLQMSIPHPPIIDWVPFPSIRDKLILCHSANPCLDEIICEVGDSYVVETDVSKLVMGVSSAKGYIGVLDLVRSISPEAENTANASSAFSNENNIPWDELFRSILELSKRMREGKILHGITMEPLATLPASSVAALFGSKQLALSTFVALGMDQGVAQYKLDPGFFERHPELYDGNAGIIIASGAHVRPPGRLPIQQPGLLNEGVLSTYRYLAGWSLDGEI
ncbi:89d52f6e-f3f9-4d68-8fd5-e716f47ad544 [Sclerotinia trifoliorum]|uniref:89d52f6e-f3f9-4d68-8fd5-e716f47ad544 n=1 Tax=Sclerotinia trifoliorum TaxID=28548 RepID=A0A8H2W3C5_9HELO|nr:89d52f6e-f3f9-4d68-8fd5-e716f47ad544 [Sclerotinia trifoliorum]